jgi:hypothetical protein
MCSVVRIRSASMISPPAAIWHGLCTEWREWELGARRF